MKNKLVCLLALISLASATSSWANRSLDEYTLKAALMVKLVRFIYLPETKQDLTQLNLCVIGSNPFGTSLNKLTENPVEGIKINIKEPLKISAYC